MAKEPFQELVQTYLSLAHGYTDETFWAFDRMVELMRDDPDEAWAVTKALIAQAANEEELAYVAAGPLEELLQEHGARFEKEIFIEARRDPTFRRALTGVWGWEQVHRPLAEALRRLFSPP